MGISFVFLFFAAVLVFVAIFFVGLFLSSSTPSLPSTDSSTHESTTGPKRRAAMIQGFFLWTLAVPILILLGLAIVPLFK